MSVKHEEFMVTGDHTHNLKMVCDRHDFCPLIDTIRTLVCSVCSVAVVVMARVGNSGDCSFGWGTVIRLHEVRGVGAVLVFWIRTTLTHS